MSEGSRQKRYFTGKPCKNGHVAERFTSNRACVVCSEQRRQAWRSKNREHEREYTRQWRQENPEKHREHARNDYWSHREQRLERVRRYQRENPEKINSRNAAYRKANLAWSRSYLRNYMRQNAHRYKEAQRRWYERNRDRVTEKCARRRALQIDRKPAWADDRMIHFFYECCPAGCHVDHVVPLQGENVCGLHVETNLQWLPASMNLSKGNRHAA